MHSISQTADDPEPARSAEQNEAFAELLTLARDRRAEFDAQLSLGDEVIFGEGGVAVLAADG